jgi:hypothetical protein
MAEEDEDLLPAQPAKTAMKTTAPAGKTMRINLESIRIS